jgi:outer membrane protein assembly factor BamB
VFTLTTSGQARSISLYTREIPLEQAFRAWWWQFFLWHMAPLPPQPRGATWLFTQRGESFNGGLAAAHGVLYFGSADGEDGGHVYALDQENGSLVWSYDASSPVSGTPIVVGDTLYITSDHGILISVDTRTGEELWQFPLESKVNRGIAYSQGALYVTSIDGTITAIE